MPIGKCDVCEKKNVHIFATFGKYKCIECLEKSKTGRAGHSGMIYKKDTKIDDYFIVDRNLCLIKVKKSHPLFVKWFIEHYPKSKGIVGRQLNYLIYDNGKPIGIISASSPPLNYCKFNVFFNKSKDISASEFCKLFLNNNVFRLVDNSSQLNLGTKILKLFRKKVFDDCKEYYHTILLGLVTFVELPRSGAIYKADNWIFLGKTAGIEVKRRGENWVNKQYIKTENKKLIFAYNYSYKNPGGWHDK